MEQRGTHLAYLGLGSNLGDGPAQLRDAIRRLGATGEVVAESDFVESEPWGFGSAHRFTNAVVALRTGLTPLGLLDATQQIERDMGRRHKHRPGEPYTDRLIDIDLLTYDDLHLQSERLTLPHPLIEERDFVRLPLAQCRAKVNRYF